MSGNHQLFLDIETMPGQRSGLYDRIAERVRPPANMSKPETIAKWEDEKKAAAAESQWLKTALDGTFGEVAAIAWAFCEGPIQSAVRGLDDSEADLLHRFGDAVCAGVDNNTTLVWTGHNITGFDLRFLWQRFVVNQVVPGILIPHNKRGFDPGIFDTMIEWSGGRIHDATSLDDLCYALGLAGKGDVAGGDVWALLADGDVDAVNEYVRADVSRVRSVYRRMTFAPVLAEDAPVVEPAVDSDADVADAF